MSIRQTEAQQPPRFRFRGATIGFAAVGGLLLVVALTLLTRDLMHRQTSAPDETASAGKPADVIRLEGKVKSEPKNWSAWAELGSAYVTAARVASDPTYYPKAEAALERSLAINGPKRNWQALAGQGALAAGRHDFVRALAFSERARELQPDSAFIRGLIVDSLTELGRYPEAVQAAQEMVDLKPNFASLARVSYQRELHGDIPGAIAAFESARDAAGTAADKAFAIYYLGELELNRNSPAAALRHYQTVLKIDPESAQALAGVGKVRAAGGDRSGAVAEYEKAVAIFPDPELLKELGDLYAAEGNRKKAAERYALMERENAKQQANGVNINLEVALSSADRKLDLDRGLAAAQEEWSLRKSIHVADALAWQLFAHKRYEEALGYADKALQLGTRNAAMYFHRAEINRALGRTEAARADYLTAASINPHFSPLYDKRLSEAIDGQDQAGKAVTNR